MSGLRARSGPKNIEFPHGMPGEGVQVALLIRRQQSRAVVGDGEGSGCDLTELE